jgi:CubicO group peptidase (beta-lactamase class C family)
MAQRTYLRVKKIVVIAMAIILLASLVGCTRDKKLPVISEVSASEITQTSAIITWTTNEPASSQLEYGLTASYGSVTTFDADLVSSHSVILGGLTTGVTYHYRVISKDASDNEAMSGDYIFTTLAYWLTSTPEEQGMDSEELVDMLNYTRNQDYGIENVTIIRNGYMVLNAYFSPFSPGSRHHIYSDTKSVISALIGIAIDQGYIESVDQPILSFFPDRAVANLDANKEAMTLKHVLTMCHGWAYEDTYVFNHQMFQSEDWVQFVLDAPMAEAPGTRFRYVNAAAFLLSAIIQETTGVDALTFAEEHLFGPLGITDVEWWSNPQGITLGYAGLFMRPEDMAKIGYLYLKGGVWDGEQIVSSTWVEESTHLHTFTDPEYGDLGYGYQWWVGYDGNDGMIFALGVYGQYICVLPQENMVVVILSDVINGKREGGLEVLKDFIIPAIKSSTKIPENPDGVASLESLLELLVNPQDIEDSEPTSFNLSINLTTTSDWTMFDLLYGASWAEQNVVQASEEATYALFSRDTHTKQDFFSLGQPLERAEEGDMVELFADFCLTDVEQWETLVFEIRRGGIGWTQVELFSHAGEESILVETLQCSNGTNICHFEVPAAALFNKELG